MGWGKSGAERKGGRDGAGGAGMSNRQGKPWTREETLAAFNFYCCENFGRLHQRNPGIIRLAELMRRTPGSVGMKLVNLASQDSQIRESGRKGLVNVSALDKQVWEEFRADRARVSYESEQAIAQLEGRALESRVSPEVERVAPPKGLDREGVRRFRVNQSFFRRAVLSAYRGRCCVTGLAVPELLNASHIIPWRENERERLNPQNGLCLNALHDRAFDRGLMTVTPDGVVRVSSRLLAAARESEKVAFIAESDGRKIETPAKFPPEREFLEHHNRNAFIPG